MRTLPASIGDVRFISRSGPNAEDARAHAARLEQKQRDADLLMLLWDQLLEMHLGELVGVYDGVVYTGATPRTLQEQLSAANVEWGDAVIHFVQHERLILAAYV